MFLILFLTSFLSNAEVKYLDPAPTFSLKGHDDKTYNLKDYAGKIVILEWLNHGCPFVKKHYDSNNMQKLQKDLTTQGVVWLSIISSAPGKQGYSTPAEAAENKMTHGSAATAILIDADGKVGQSYGAMTTPHMFIINQKGLVAYQGAIDDTASTDPADIKNSKNYVSQVASELLKGKEPSVKNSKAYGCSVKY
ncbi:MAG: thioredoxin family protein [Bacteriovoracaceae bacterium]|nr:thioredoxin family protein [Bacteriovoracaceae bacterium]